MITRLQRCRQFTVPKLDEGTSVVPAEVVAGGLSFYQNLNSLADANFLGSGPKTCQFLKTKSEYGM